MYIYIYIYINNGHIFLYYFYLDNLYAKILNVINCNWTEWFHALIPIQFARFYLTNLLFYFVLYLIEFSLNFGLKNYIYIYIYYLVSNGLHIVMIYYINDLYIWIFLVIQKKAHKYKIIQTLSSSNFIYWVKYMIRFFMVYLYWNPCFLH